MKIYSPRETVYVIMKPASGGCLSLQLARVKGMTRQAIADDSIHQWINP